MRQSTLEAQAALRVGVSFEEEASSARQQPGSEHSLAASREVALQLEEPTVEGEDEELPTTEQHQPCQQDLRFVSRQNL